MIMIDSRLVFFGGSDQYYPREGFIEGPVVCYSDHEFYEEERKGQFHLAVDCVPMGEGL